MTQNCIHCGQEAKIFTGHVLRGKEMITAGWCKDHIHISDDFTKMQSPGCFGNWELKYGIRKNFETT